MITRFAFFEGHVNEGQTEAFRAAVLAEVLPFTGRIHHHITEAHDCVL